MKIKHFFSRTALVLFAISTLTYSCFQDELQPSVETAETTLTQHKIEFENGVLIFQDQAHFEEVLNNVRKDSEKAAELLAEFSSFQPLQLIIDNAMTELDATGRLSDELDLHNFFEYDEANEFYDLVYPFYSRSMLLNPNGVVQVGQDLVKYDRNFVYTVADRDFSKLNGISEITTVGLNDGVFTSAVKQFNIQTNREEISAICRKSIEISATQSLGMYTWIRGYSWSTSSAAYLDITAFLRKLGAGGFITDAHNNMQGNYTYSFNDNTISKSYNHTSSNGAMYWVSLESLTDNTFPFSEAFTLTGTHSGTGYFSAGPLSIYTVACSVTY